MVSSNTALSAEEYAIAMAELQIRGMTTEYILRTDESIAECIALAIHLRAQKDRTAGDIRQIFRKLHDIKGQGGTFDYHLITASGAIACNIVRERPSLSDEALVVLEKCIQAMQTVLQRRITGNGGENGKKLVEKLSLLAKPHLRADPK